jgi:hypothetical protein
LIAKDDLGDPPFGRPVRVWDHVNVSRYVLAHMNPLDADDIKNIEAGFLRWTKQLKGIEARLP